MNEFPIPPFPLWSKVAHAGEIWTVAGFYYRQGYQVYGWDYLLTKTFTTADSEYLGEGCKTVNARDDQITTLQVLLEERTQSAGKYATETRRIADEAQKEHERLLAQVRG